MLYETANAESIMTDISRLSEDEVLNIRRIMASTNLAVRDAFGEVEPLNFDKLSMAVQRQNTSLGSKFKYNGIAEVGAALLSGITMAHAFENGNKRTALVSLLVFLDLNRYLLVSTTEDDLYEMVREIAAHEINIGKKKRTPDSETAAIAKWINSKIRHRVLGEFTLSFSDLREILTNLGCEFSSPDKNFIKIKRDRWMVRTGYPRENFEVPKSEVRKIRRSLRLDEVHGTDSAGFYNYDAKVDMFVNKYRNLMKRLADL